MLRAEIEALGLGAFIATSQVDLAVMFADTADPREVPDPLMAAHFSIIDNLVRAGGSGIMFMDGCPLCIANQAHKDHCEGPDCTFSYDEWIKRAADDTAAAFKQRGLLGQETQ